MLLTWGILLAGGAGSLIGLLIAGNVGAGPTYVPQMLGQAFPMTPSLNPLGLFCSGVALGVIFCVGVSLIARRAAVARRHRTDTPHPTPVAPLRWAATAPPGRKSRHG